MKFDLVVPANWSDTEITALVTFLQDKIIEELKLYKPARAQVDIISKRNEEAENRTQVSFVMNNNEYTDRAYEIVGKMVLPTMRQLGCNYHVGFLCRAVKVPAVKAA